MLVEALKIQKACSLIGGLKSMKLEFAFRTEGLFEKLN